MRAGRRSTAATNHKEMTHLKLFKILSKTPGDRLKQNKAEFGFEFICLSILSLHYHSYHAFRFLHTVIKDCNITSEVIF